MRLVWIFVFLIFSGCASIPNQASYSGNASNTEDTETKVKMASNAFRNGDHDRALSLYKEVIAAENWNRKANYNMSIVHLELAVKGFEFIGQFIDNTQDAALAREYLDTAIENMNKYLDVSQNYVSSN